MLGPSSWQASTLITVWRWFGHESLSQAAKDVDASQDALVDSFERIENFFERSESYAALR